MHEDDNDDERYGWRFPSREQRARQEKKDANKKKADRYYAYNFREIKLRKQWNRELKIKTRRACLDASVGHFFGSGLSTGLLFPSQPHAADAKLFPAQAHAPNTNIIVIHDSEDEKDDPEVVFAWTGRSAVINDSPVVSFLPD